MQHKKIKTEPCLSPESPFMRKPSKEFLQKLAYNKAKPKEHENPLVQSSEYYAEQNISKILFIPVGIAASIDSLRSNPIKLKKTTIDMGKFKIKHENLLLKTEQQEMKRKNTELTEENKALRKQIEELRKQLESGSRISKFSQETLERTDSGAIKKKNTLMSLGSQQSLLEIHSYEILPTTMEISQVNSLVFDEQFKCPEETNFLSSSLGKKHKRNDSKQSKTMKELSWYKQQIQILQNRISYLERELQNSLLREKQLESSNKRLQLSASMSQRRLDSKESQLKEFKRKEKQKQYLEKLYELSSEQDHEAE